VILESVLSNTQDYEILNNIETRILKDTEFYSILYITHRKNISMDRPTEYMAGVLVPQKRVSH
jgi:hypothetical protein